MTDLSKIRVAASKVLEPVSVQSKQSSKERVKNHTHRAHTHHAKASTKKNPDGYSMKGYVEDLLLSTFETILNQSLASHPEVTSRLKPFNNQIIRIKTVDPYSVVFMKIKGTQISLQTDTQEVVHARVRIPSLALAWCLFGPLRHTSPPWDLASGNADLLGVLEFWVNRWDFWQTVQQMLRQRMPEFQEFLHWFETWYRQRRPESEWIDRLRTVLLDWSAEQKKQRVILRDQQIALRSLALQAKQHSFGMSALFWMLLITNFTLIFLYAGFQQWIEPTTMRQILMAIAATISCIALFRWRALRSSINNFKS
ncbi:MAG: hypothetical protein V4629_04310 [Pseudomonadota bacterium]